MKDRAKWLGKLLLQGVIWVFVLSIQWHGRPMFSHAHAVLVDNAVVASVDAGLNEVWHRLQRATKVAFAKSTPDDPYPL